MSTAICLLCDRPVRCCGLCSGCYQSSLAQVKAKKTSWSRLVKNGKAIRSKRGPKSRVELTKGIGECSSSQGKSTKVSTSAKG